MFSCKNSPSWYFIGVQCDKFILTLLIAQFKNATQKETSDVLNNGRISCELCHFFVKGNQGHSIHLFFALYWSFCVSVPIILLLFHNFDGITGLFFPCKQFTFHQQH